MAKSESGFFSGIISNLFGFLFFLVAFNFFFGGINFEKIASVTSEMVTNVVASANGHCQKAIVGEGADGKPKVLDKVWTKDCGESVVVFAGTTLPGCADDKPEKEEKKDPWGN